MAIRGRNITIRQQGDQEGPHGAPRSLAFRRPTRRVFVSSLFAVALATLMLFSASAPSSAARLAPRAYSIAGLSPQLNSYLQRLGSIAGVTIYDVTRNRIYSYNDSRQFLLASSAKIPIMLDYFHTIESRGQRPSSHDVALLARMIENSDNNAAQYFYSELGYGAGLRRYLASVGAWDYTPSAGGFGWGRLAPRDMVHLLTAFYYGQLTNSSDRALGLSLMQRVESDQRMGVGYSAPRGAYVALKDGWVQGPDRRWATNSSGIISYHGETYIISVYTQELGSLNYGFGILNSVCAQAERALVR